jgi:hypothetical protein
MLWAGQRPKAIPPLAETLKAVAMAVRDEIVRQSKRAAAASDAPWPGRIPIGPPQRQRISASAKKLAQNVPCPCADNHPEPDLTGAFRYGSEHDVHGVDSVDD